MNTVTIVGNITAQPELRYTPSGAAVANFTVAVNKRVKTEDEWTDELEGFFRCNVWRDQAENVANLSKGQRVVVVGRLKQRSWEAKDGSKRDAVEIEVEEVAVSQKFKAKAGASASSSEGGWA